MDISKLNIKTVAAYCIYIYIYIKQHLSNIWSTIHEKLSNTQAELKNSVGHKIKRVLIKPNDLLFF